MVATLEHIRPSACPACNAAPLAEHLAALPKDATMMLSLPGIHCAGCISGVERALLAVPGVTEARVNLTLRRAAVQAAPEVAIETLCAVLEREGFEAHELDPGVLATTDADRAGRDLLMRLAVAFFAMMNVMLLSVAVWSGADGVTRDMMHWISAAIAIPAVIFSGRPFFASAWSALRVRRLNMDVPITLALVLALVTSSYETIHSGHHAYFDAAVMLCFFLLGGRYLDHRTRASARSAAQELAALEVPRAIRVTQAGEETVSVAELAVGDIVRVRPGGRIPVDGRVTLGASEIDRSLMTGESLPHFAGVGSFVSAGEVNLTGPLSIEVTAAGRDTALHRIADLVAVAESGRANYNSLADQASKLYAPGVHILAVVSAVGWWLYTQDLRISLNIAAAVLIITCPCALALAVPAVTTAASGRLFRKGLLIKDGTALERLAEADTVLFDKTGTLTTGAPTPLALDHLPQDAARIALALAQGSAHPLAVSLAQALAARGLRPAQVSDLREVPGYGVEGQWQGQTVRLGRAAWVGAEALPDTASYLQIGTDRPCAIRFADTLRDGAADVVAALIGQGKRVILISGDTKASVTRFAQEIGIAEVIAEALPQEKAALVADLTAAGAKVLMVGDGLNDAGALRQADAGFSVVEDDHGFSPACDGILESGSISALPRLLRFARSCVRVVRWSFVLSFLYNAVGITMAVQGLISPLFAAILMPLSSVSIIAFSTLGTRWVAAQNGFR